MKVIIVDDEIQVGNLIKNLIEWEDLSLELIGVFQSGLDVLKRFETEPADILICDIEMPDMSGLELVEKISDLYPSTKCLIVSGFRNFEYARQAMKFGVVHYILKPVDEEELNHALRELSETSSSERKKTASERENLLTSLIDGSYEPLSINDINRNYGYQFIDSQFFFVKIHSSSIKMMEAIMSSLLAKIPLLCADFGLLGRNKNSSSVLVNLNSSSKKEDVVNLLYECLSSAEGTLKEPAYIFVGDSFVNTATMKEELDKVDKAGWERLFLNKNGVYYVKEEKQYEAFALSDNENNALMKAVESLDKEKIRTLIEDVFHEREEVLKEAPSMTVSLVALIAMSTFNKMYNLGVRSDDFNVVRKKINDGLDEAVRLEDLISFFTDLMYEDIKSKLVIHTDEESDYIRQAKGYIQKNYNQAISLESLAEELALNQSYVSSLFKEGTGINFKQYLTDVRIDNAKRLLRETNKNLSEIAYEVGYKNAFYFAQTFLTHEGIRPQEYRKIHRSTK